MRRTSGPQTPDDDETGEIPLEPDAVGHNLNDLTAKVDGKAPVWFAFVFFVIVAALCGSGAIWVIVNMWRDILR